MHYIISIVALALAINFCALGCTDSNGTATSRQERSTEGDLVSETYFADREKDIRKIEDVLNKVKDIADRNERIIVISGQFIGIPYVGGTLNIPSEEQLYVNTSGVDCSTFVETVLALAIASERENPDVNDFLECLRMIRYRDGKIDGFPSRLHYNSEWALDNTRRATFCEITADCDLAESRVKTLDFMTKNRGLYPPMARDEVFEGIKENEKALKNLRYSIILTAQVDKAAKNFLKSGDIVGIVTNKPGLDVSHVGIVRIKNGIPYLTHASSKYKKVVDDTMPLKAYLQKQGSPGIRVYRL